MRKPSRIGRMKRTKWIICNIILCVMVVLPEHPSEWVISREALALLAISMIKTLSSRLPVFVSRWSNGKKLQNSINKEILSRKLPAFISKLRCSQQQLHLWTRSHHHQFLLWLQKPKKLKRTIKRLSMHTREQMIMKTSSDWILTTLETSKRQSISSGPRVSFRNVLRWSQTTAKPKEQRKKP